MRRKLQTQVALVHSRHIFASYKHTFTKDNIYDYILVRYIDFLLGFIHRRDRMIFVAFCRNDTFVAYNNEYRPTRIYRDRRFLRHDDNVKNVKRNGLYIIIVTEMLRSN